MKKFYSLLFLVVTSVSFGQILTDSFNYPDNALLTDNGWTVHSGGTTEPIDVGASNGLTYAGYNTTVGNAARLDNNGQDVNKAFTAPVTTGNVYFSFLVNVSSAVEGYFVHLGPGGTATSPYAARVFVKPSVNAGKINFGFSNTSTASYAATPTDFDLNTTYLIIVKAEISSTGAASMWVKSTGVPTSEAAAGAPEHTTSGSGVTSVNAFYLRQYNAGLVAAIDEVKVYTTWFGETPCALTLGNTTTLCDANTLSETDTYTATIPFTGGNSGTYNLSTTSGTIGGDNPSTTTEGNIVISGITEGVNVTLTVSGACNFTKAVTAPECKPINTLPYAEDFNYSVGTSIGSTQKWTNANSGDAITVSSGNLNYSGFTSSGNSITFSGSGAESLTPFTSTTTGTIFASFIVSVTDIANITADPSVTYFAGLTDGSTGGYNARLFFNRVGTQYQLGFDSASTTTNYDATLRNVGDVVFVVMGYDFNTNTLNAWINPDLTTFSETTPATLTVTPTTAPTAFGGFIFRQDAAATTPTIVADELRIGTTVSQLLAVSQNAIKGLAVYPNPATHGVLFVETAANAERTIAIYDVLGKNVLNTTTSSSEVNISTLKGGVYIVKITEEGKTATRKLIIK